MEKVLFTEEQRFTQKWLWLIIIGAMLITIVPSFSGIYSLEILGKPLGDKPVNFKGLVVVVIFELVFWSAIILLFIYMRLTVEIKSDGIYLRFPPLVRKWKTIRKDEIESFAIRTYRPVREYGGWGVKGNTRNKAYNVSGNIGLQLKLKNGRKLLIGTQKSQAIGYAMEKMLKRENSSKNG